MKTLQLVLLLPFFFAASALVVIAGLIGNRSWHVSIGLEEHKGEPLGSVEIN